jgi:hypothetical protein
MSTALQAGSLVPMLMQMAVKAGESVYLDANYHLNALA